MGNHLYIIAVVLVILWAIGYLGFSPGGIIHILPFIAVIAVFSGSFKGEEFSLDMVG